MNADKIHLVQLRHPSLGRRIALVNEPELVLLKDFLSVYDLAMHTVETNTSLQSFIPTILSAEKLKYDDVYEGKSEWRLLPSFDHPGNPLFCMVAGTGLTHKNSALNRQMMHTSVENKPTDSMQMYQWGVEGGNPEKGKIGVQPEWFYKGNGSVLKAHGERLDVPSYANDGGEEPELAGIYIIDKEGRPWRIGFSTGNEFSDHVMEKKNYLYLAPSKLRTCSVGPELVIDANFAGFQGEVSITRNDKQIWSAAIHSGAQNMAHNLANLEYHHFKYPSHRIPLQAHVHFFGADAFSFGSQIVLQDGDLMRVFWEGMGRPLVNPVYLENGTERFIEIRSI